MAGLSAVALVRLWRESVFYFFNFRTNGRRVVLCKKRAKLRNRTFNDIKCARQDDVLASVPCVSCRSGRLLPLLKNPRGAGVKNVRCYASVPFRDIVYNAGLSEEPKWCPWQFRLTCIARGSKRRQIVSYDRTGTCVRGLP